MPGWHILETLAYDPNRVTFLLHFWLLSPGVHGKGKWDVGEGAVENGKEIEGWT